MGGDGTSGRGALVAHASRVRVAAPLVVAECVCERGGAAARRPPKAAHAADATRRQAPAAATRAAGVAAQCARPLEALLCGRRRPKRCAAPRAVHVAPPSRCHRAVCRTQCRRQARAAAADQRSTARGVGHVGCRGAASPDAPTRGGESVGGCAQRRVRGCTCALVRVDCARACARGARGAAHRRPSAGGQPGSGPGAPLLESSCACRPCWPRPRSRRCPRPCHAPMAAEGAPWCRPRSRHRARAQLPPQRTKPRPHGRLAVSPFRWLLRFWRRRLRRRRLWQRRIGRQALACWCQWCHCLLSALCALAGGSWCALDPPCPRDSHGLAARHTRQAAELASVAVRARPAAQHGASSDVGSGAGGAFRVRAPPPPVPRGDGNVGALGGTLARLPAGWRLAGGSAHAPRLAQLEVSAARPSRYPSAPSRAHVPLGALPRLGALAAACCDAQPWLGAVSHSDGAARHERPCTLGYAVRHGTSPRARRRSGGPGHCVASGGGVPSPRTARCIPGAPHALVAARALMLPLSHDTE